MTDEREALHYHGRRSLDERLGVLNAPSGTIAQVHEKLSLLHFTRLVSLLATASNRAQGTPSAAPKAEKGPTRQEDPLA